MSPRSAKRAEDEPSAEPRTSTRVLPWVSTYSDRTPMSRPGARPNVLLPQLKRLAWLTPPFLLLVVVAADAMWIATAPPPSGELIATVVSQANGPCSDLQVVGLRGHNDQLDTNLGLGVDDWALTERLRDQFASHPVTFSTYALPYSQERDLAGLPVSVPRDISPGSDLLVAYLSRRSAQCPTENRVLIAQSEGGAIVHWAYPQIARWIEAAVLLGDPLHIPSAGYNEPAAAGGRGQLDAWLGRGFGIGPLRAPDPISQADGVRVKSYCLPHDQVCDWNPFDPHPDAHLDYRLNLPLWASGPGVLDLAARFITGRVARAPQSVA